MQRFHGTIGFWTGDAETSSGIWEPQFVEKKYFGDVKRNSRRFQPNENQNDNLVVNVQLSIIGDLYVRENWTSIRYVVWNGVAWKATSINIEEYPRIIIQLGEVYNGKRPTGTGENS